MKEEKNRKKGMFRSEDGSWNYVLIISLVLCLAITAWAIVAPSGFGRMADGLMGFITKDFGWLYMLGVAFFLFFCICSPTVSTAFLFI